MQPNHPPQLKAPELIRRLTENGVEFVVIGGLACVMHGLGYTTEDLDVCASMTEANIQRLLAALQDLDPRLRMRPDKMPLPRTVEGLRGVLNLYLQTDWGLFDLLGDVAGIGDYKAAATLSVEMDVDGTRCKVLSLESLITAKRASGRRKDLLAVIDLEEIKKLRDKGPS